MTTEAPTLSPAGNKPAAEPRTLTSTELLRGAREISILHAGEAYRLRLTSNDRLILTK
jgi:hemin uptake protein HemP